MNIPVQIDDYARRLYAASGDRAEYEAAQKARDCEARGAGDEAEQWRKVREKIRILRGPNAS
ncbi:hypothetical protein [Amaricoccus sp.]|uniref:hypothetical protein n=1 Tax=Amaricoccus sp. TaxID=1872485 RepID=UPI001B463FEC|nr:hypothetical protein [Amaricoccus sp.]MBP7002018.1 hypothetical protein [Amaricoccus sp.]